MTDIDNSENPFLNETKIKLESEGDDCSDMAVITIKEEILNYDEIDLKDEVGLNYEIDLKTEIGDDNQVVGDSYEFADTSLPEDTESCSSDAVSLLVDSALKSHSQVYKDVNSSFKNNSKSVVKLLLVDDNDDKELLIDTAQKSDVTGNVLPLNAVSLDSKYERKHHRNQNLTTLKPVEVKINKLTSPVLVQFYKKITFLPAIKPPPKKIHFLPAIKPPPRPSVEYQFKCSECTAQFELKSHLIMHEIGHESYKKYCQLRSQLQNHEFSHMKQKYTCTVCKASFQLGSQLENHALRHMKRFHIRCLCRGNKTANNGDWCTCIVRDCRSCGRKFFTSIKLGNWRNCIKCFYEKKTRKVQEIRTYLPAGNKQITGNSVTSREVVRKLCFFCAKMKTYNIYKYGKLTPWMCFSCWSVRKGVDDYRKVSKFQETRENVCQKPYPMKSLVECHNLLRKSMYFEEENTIGYHFLRSSNIPHEPSPSDSDKDEDDDDEMVIDITSESDSDNSPPDVILCDKTGELIDLGLTKDLDTN